MRLAPRLGGSLALRHRAAALMALMAVLTAAPAAAATPPAARAHHAMVAGPEPIAVDRALAVLRSGGNAVDAAVTMALVLAVTHPQAGNLGGGGYMLIRMATGESVVIDYRETAPAAATRDMFLDAAGAVAAGESLRTYRASGVPGTVAGLALALEKHGSIRWAAAVRPAIELARHGFVVGRGLEENLENKRAEMEAWPATRKIFFKDGAPLKEGDRLTQPELAQTLKTLEREGPRSFYTGRIARTLEADMKTHGGLITAADLAAYRPIERPPLTGRYRSFDVLTTPPSSAGGVALLETLRMLEPFDLKALGHGSSAYIHLVCEATKRAFADRSRWLGDPAFTAVPLAQLLSPSYAAARMKGFDPERATPAETAGPGDPLHEGQSTTHFSILDEAGNVVSNTYTLNERFGNGAVVEGLGFLLNNEMDDFASAPGQPNLFGLTGSEANSIAPGKRMLSSMMPTILLDHDPAGRTRPRLVVGSPGGSAIITAVLQVVLGVADFDMELREAVDAPRFHHQWLPDRIGLEKGFSADVWEALRRRGHVVVEADPRGEIQAILTDRDGAWIRGASDSRGYGLARGY